MKNHILSILAVAVLTACGGASTSSTESSQKTQSKLQSIKQATSSYQGTVQALYVAYFGRPADPGGLTNFSASLLAAGAPTDVAGLVQAYSTNAGIKQLIDSFGTSKESQTLYGSGNASDFVTAVFQNVLGRAPAASGLQYWSSAISSGSLSQGNAALAIMAGALANTTAQGLMDAKLINARLAAAANFTALITEQGMTSNYAGATAAAAARSLLSTVTPSTDPVGMQVAVSNTLGAMGPSIELLAGSAGGSGYVDGYADQARFGLLVSAAPDHAGNVYIGDGYGNTIRKLSNGMVSTVAGVPSSPGFGGHTDGKGSAATLDSPQSLVADANGNVYFAGFASIRKMTPDGTVTTIAGNELQTGFVDGKGSAAGLNMPLGLAVDANGTLYFSDYGNNTVRKMTPDGTVTTIGGVVGAHGHNDGAAILATFYSPAEVAVDAAGNVFVADSGNSLIRKISPQGVVSTVAGNFAAYKIADGQGTSASFQYPYGLTIDSAGNLYVGDVGTIRKVTPQGFVTTIAGNANATAATNVADGAGVQASFQSLGELHSDAAGNIYVGDGTTVRLVTPSGVVSTIAGQAASRITTVGTGTQASFMDPVGISVDGAGNVYVADFTGYSVRIISPSGNASMLVGRTTDNQITDPLQNLNPFVPVALTVSPGGTLYVGSNHQINVVASNGAVNAIAGLYPGSVDGTGTGASLNSPAAMTSDANGNIYFTDNSLNNVRMMTPGGTVTTVTDGKAPISINSPAGIAVDAAGYLYVVGTTDSVIMKIKPGVSSQVFAGKPGAPGIADGVGQAASFYKPKGMAIDASGNLYVADWGNCTIRKITPDGTVTTVVGQPNKIGIRLGALPGQISFPQALAFDANGVLYATSATAILKIHLH